MIHLTYPPKRRFLSFLSKRQLFKHPKIFLLQIQLKMFIKCCQLAKLKKTVKGRVPSEVYFRMTKVKIKFQKHHLNLKHFDRSSYIVC